jgi:hypothetical protein
MGIVFKVRVTQEESLLAVESISMAQSAFMAAISTLTTALISPSEQKTPIYFSKVKVTSY